MKLLAQLQKTIVLLTVFVIPVAAQPSAVSVGYAVIENGPTNSRHDGVAILTYRKDGIVISETVVESTAATQRGIVYAETGNWVKTGLAIANPSRVAATVSLSLAGADGKIIGQSSIVLPPTSQVARFLDEAPLSFGSTVGSVLTFEASDPVYVTAFRGLINERSEFILTTIPIVGTNPATGPVIIPHFADGNGWSTETILMNPTTQSMRGSIQFFNQETQGVTTVLMYSIPAGGTYRFKTPGTAPTTEVGSVWIVPSNNFPVPAAFGIFSFRQRGVTVSEASMPAGNGVPAYRLYVESSDDVRTGIVIANPSAAPVTVNVQATTLNGVSMGGITSFTIPGRGQISRFADQIHDFNGRGLLRITTTAAAGIIVAGLRARYNERDDFLVAGLPAIGDFPSVAAELMFPHFAEGAGYTTEFVLFSGNPTPDGTVKLFDQSGHPISAW